MRKLVLAGSPIVVCASVLSVLFTPDGGEVTGPSFTSERRLTPNPAESVALSGLLLPAQARISTLLGRDDSGYHAVTHLRGFRAQNPEHQLAAEFTESGVEVRAGTATWKLALRGYGYGDDLRAAAAIAPQASTNRVEYRRDSLTEWYVNGPLGLEQGFTLAEPPAATRDEPLTLAFAIAGTLTASPDRTGRGALLKRSDGTVALRYRGLTAHDSLGRELHASMHVDGGNLLLQVDDIGAQYPVIVDPFIQQARLTGSDSVALDEFGTSVAMSGDTIVVGALRGDGVAADAGAAYVFVMPASEWSGDLVETAKLIASDGAFLDEFGVSVGIDADTIVVGARAHDTGGASARGAAYVFVKPEGGWNGILSENAKLTATGATGSITLGRSVAISGDTVVAGASQENFGQGAGYVFVKPANGWNGPLTESAKLVGSDRSGGDFLGTAIAMSGDTIAVGAPQAEPVGGFTDQGSAYVFVKPAGGWSGTLTESARLVASDAADFDLLGWSVALREATIVAGAPEVGFLNGALYVFGRPSAGWSGILTESAKLVGSDGGGRLGVSAAISGNTVTAGAFIDNATAGKAYIFLRPPGGWIGIRTQNQIIPAPASSSGTVLSPRFGAAAAASGGTLVISESRERVGFNNSQGAVYIFRGPEADLSLSKVAPPGPVLAGNDLTYTITVTNNGPDDATSVTVTDNLPPELTFGSCNATGGGACGGSDNSRTVTFASLPVGASETITITANVAAAAPDGSISNTALVTGATSDPNSDNDSDTVAVSVIHQADLALTKTASASAVQVGTNVTYLVTLANTGPNSALNATLTDALPPGLTFVSNSGANGWTCVNPAAGSGGTITCSITSLASGGTATFTIVANVSCGVTHGTVIANQATLSSSTPDPNSSNNTSTASATASNPTPVVAAAVATSLLSATNMPVLVNVGLSATASDGACAAPAVSSVEVFGDEDDETPIARNEVFSPDAADIGVGTLRLRAERVKNLDGRVYLIVVRAVDAAGGVAFATATVAVPQKPGPASIASVNAQAAAAKSYADGHGGSPPPGFFVIGDGPAIGPLQ